jgi:hypothetical protein
LRQEHHDEIFDFLQHRRLTGNTTSKVLCMGCPGLQQLSPWTVCFCNLEVSFSQNHDRRTQERYCGMHKQQRYQHSPSGSIGTSARLCIRIHCMNWSSFTIRMTYNAPEEPTPKLLIPQQHTMRAKSPNSIF